MNEQLKITPAETETVYAGQVLVYRTITRNQDGSIVFGEWSCAGCHTGHCPHIAAVRNHLLNQFVVRWSNRQDQEKKMADEQARLRNRRSISDVLNDAMEGDWAS